MREDLFALSCDKTGNVPTGIDHMKKFSVWCLETELRSELPVLYFVINHYKKYFGLGCGTAVYNGILP